MSESKYDLVCLDNSKIELLDCGFGEAIIVHLPLADHVHLFVRDHAQTKGAIMNLIGFTLIVVFLRALAVLPYGLVARFGSVLGALLYLIPSHRKHIVEINLRLCFPTMTAAEHNRLGRSHFRHVVRSYVERGVQWFGSARAITDLVALDSRIDLNDSNAPPTIFMGFHFVAIEVGCMLYSMNAPITALYSGRIILRLVPRRSEAPNKTLLVTNFERSPATASTAAARMLASSPPCAEEA
jgi:hypothetical protein